MRRYFHRSLRLRSLPLPARWGGSALLVCIAFGARYLLYGLTPDLPFLCFFSAVIVASVIFDRGSGFFAMALSAVLVIYFFTDPPFNFALENKADIINVVLFCLVGVFIAIVTEALHAAYAEAEQAHRVTEIARQRAEAGEREREVLLAEFRHRVSNDLQRIAGLLELQALRAAPDAASALREASTRVHVIARVHDRLARRDGHVLVDVREFLHDLVADLRATVTDLQPIGLFIEAETHLLSVSRTGSLGLIVNELVTNALKYAFPDPDRSGAIKVSFRQDGADFLLTVTDDGVGVTDNLSAAPRSNGGMGTRLVRSLVAQLGGSIESSAQPGAGMRHLLRFPITPPGDPDHPPFPH